MLSTIKNNPIKILLGSSGSIIALVGAMFTLDSRYAHAEDVEKDAIKTQKMIQDTSTILRKQMLEDKVFELEVKKAQAKGQGLTPIESAMHERYLRQLNELSAPR